MKPDKFVAREVQAHRRLGGFRPPWRSHSSGVLPRDRGPCMRFALPDVSGPADLHARLSVAGEIEPQHPIHLGLPARALRLEPVDHIGVEANGDALLAGSIKETRVSRPRPIGQLGYVARIDLVIRHRLQGREFRPQFRGELRNLLQSHDVRLA